MEIRTEPSHGEVEDQDSVCAAVGGFWWVLLNHVSELQHFSYMSGVLIALQLLLVL